MSKCPLCKERILTITKNGSDICVKCAFDIWERVERLFNSGKTPTNMISINKSMITTNDKHKTCRKCKGHYFISDDGKHKQWSIVERDDLEIGLCYRCDKRYKS